MFWANVPENKTVVALRWGGLAALGLDEANVREERGETRPGELTVPGPRGRAGGGDSEPRPGAGRRPRLLSRATGWSVRPSHSCAHRNVGGVVPGGLARRGAGLGRCGDEVALRAARESDGGRDRRPGSGAASSPARPPRAPAAPAAARVGLAPRGPRPALSTLLRRATRDRDF